MNNLVAVAWLLGEQNQRGSSDVAAPRAAASSSATWTERPERTAESERTTTETAPERTAERGWAELATAVSAVAVPMPGTVPTCTWGEAGSAA